MSNLRKLKRDLKKKSLKYSNSNFLNVISKYINLAISGKERVGTISNFVFFSSNGDSWLLHPEEGLALPLVRNFEKQQYTVGENSQQLFVEWEYHFKIEPCFTTIDISTQKEISVYPSYPKERLLKICLSITKVRE